ncbi:hypothetical protein PR048_029895 [Dryococelus australis]|uniref:Uncharacterized protein n=1 Tax=Dryococelus australis TaxID=614101 RepID=A0ABQ9GBB8_9NEOP|nr:hypothetical protein PR048_029895 [Dryococelus australis]
MHPKTGKEMARSYIHYSVTNDRLCCFCCWLFSKTSDPNLDPAFSRVGVCNWRKIHVKVVKHEKSFLHRNALISWRMVCSNTLIDGDLLQQHEQEVTNWKNILRRIIDVILFLSAQSLAFRGSVEQLGHSRRGNFLALVSLLANILATEFRIIQQAIIAAVKVAQYYSVMVDTTTDTSHTDQLSFIIQYDKIDEQVQVTESFLGFIRIPGDEARASSSVYQEMKQEPLTLWLKCSVSWEIGDRILLTVEGKVMMSHQ